MPLTYRAMLRDGDKPKIGPTKKTLGVQPGNGQHDDLAPDNDGNVAPGSGGMSVAPNWWDLPGHRIPRRLRDRCAKATGNDEYACWRMGDGAFANGKIGEELILSAGRNMKHGTVQPAFVMQLAQFQAALAETQDQWLVDEE